MRVWILALVVVAGGAFWLGRTSAPARDAGPEAPDLTPHERYERRLRAAGLDSAALGRLWIRAGARALEAAPPAALPFEESGYLDPERPDAVAYRFEARAGQRLRVRLEVEPPSNARFFLDLYRAPADAGASGEPEGGSVERVASAGPGERELVHEPGRDGAYLVRIQPELLRGGRYTLRVGTEPTFAFPVAGTDVGSVGSFFGDPRDGGRRDHHGIDIFARRGTPVVAATGGLVRSVRTTPIGGRVVWLRDEARGQSLYHAHLEEQLVEPGQRVEPGDTLGLVGNSGNARTTPPHLHFGIYRRGFGPLDPMPFVEPPPAVQGPPYLPRSAAGGLRRVVEPAVLRSAPAADAPGIGSLDPEAPVRVLGIAGEWLRVEVADGRSGFLPGPATTAGAPLATLTLRAPAALRDRPEPSGVQVAEVGAGARVEVLGRIGGHLYVRVPEREAWLLTPDPSESAPSL